MSADIDPCSDQAVQSHPRRGPQPLSPSLEDFPRLLRVFGAQYGLNTGFVDSSCVSPFVLAVSESESELA